MNRRKFLSECSVGVTLLTVGCLDFTSSPSIEITSPDDGSSVDQNFTLSAQVSNYTIEDPTIPIDPENTGYVVVSVDEELEQGRQIDDPDENINEWLDGQLEDSISLQVPGTHTIRTYLADTNRVVTEYSDSITVDSSFNIPSEVTLGQNQTLNVDPNSISIPVGTTVTFNWETNGISLDVIESPDGAEWEGVPTPQAQGHTYEYQFQNEGVYRYQCEPHSDVMQGTIRVI